MSGRRYGFRFWGIIDLGVLVWKMLCRMPTRHPSGETAVGSRAQGWVPCA